MILYFKMSDSKILNEVFDDDYEPNEDGIIYSEIIEYAKWLGMKLPEDEDLLYIAKEGLKAPLPDPWKPCKTHDDDIYYFNFKSGESVWEHPCDKYYREMYERAKAARDSRKSNEDRRKKPLREDSSDLGSNLRAENPVASSRSRYSDLFEVDKRKAELEEKFQEEITRIRSSFEEKVFSNIEKTEEEGV